MHRFAAWRALPVDLFRRQHGDGRGRQHRSAFQRQRHVDIGAQLACAVPHRIRQPDAQALNGAARRHDRI